MQPDDVLLEKIREVTASLFEAEGVEIVEMTYRYRGPQKVLQILVDTPGGIQLGQCAQLNRQISEILDRLSVIDEPFLLEVASPGLDRPLLTARDFARTKGCSVRIFLKTPLFYKTEYEGVVEDVEGETVHLRLAEGTLLEIPLAQVAKGKRLVHF